MHRTDAPGFGPGNAFQEGQPGTGLLASVVGAKWLNATQEELVALVEAAGLAPDDEDNGQVLAALQLLFSAGNASAALKNRIVNGGFELWQRGTSIAVGSTTIFTADRWAANADGAGSGTATVSRQAFALGQTNVPGAPKNYLRWTQTANATAAPVIFQPLEDVERYSSGTITVSFWARCSSSVNTVTRAFQVFGSGGSPTVAVGAQPITITTTWARYVVTYDLPSVAGKTIGAGSYLRIGVSLPVGSTFTFDLADFQVEFASAASAFDRRPAALEYLFAARYFQKSYDLETAPGTVTTAGAFLFNATRVESVGGVFLAETKHYGARERFVVPMRAVPTVAWWAPLGQGSYPAGGNAVSIELLTGTADVWFGFDVVANNNATQESTGYPTRADVSADGALPTVSGGNGLAHWTANAELL